MNRQLTPDLLGRLLDEHGGALVLFATQWTDSPDDCVQEAFIQLTRQARLPENVAAWLFQVVRNRAISLARSASRRRRHETLAASFLPACSGEPAENDPPVTAEQLAEALQSLDDSQREVIVAHIWGGLGFEEIAAVVGAATSTAHRRYEAGLRILRERLESLCQPNLMASIKTNP